MSIRVSVIRVLLFPSTHGLLWTSFLARLWKEAVAGGVGDVSSSGRVMMAQCGCRASLGVRRVALSAPRAIQTSEDVSRVQTGHPDCMECTLSAVGVYPDA